MLILLHKTPRWASGRDLGNEMAKGIFASGYGALGVGGVVVAAVAYAFWQNTSDVAVDGPVTSGDVATVEPRTDEAAERTLEAPAPAADMRAALPEDPTPAPLATDGNPDSDTAQDAAEDALPDRQQGPVTLPDPRFDLVRAESDGQVLIAGTSAPGDDLRIDVDGETSATGSADGQGGFVLFLSLPLGDAPKVLDLIATGADGVERRADESIILAPPQRVADADTRSEELPSEAALAAVQPRVDEVGVVGDSVLAEPGTAEVLPTEEGRAADVAPADLAHTQEPPSVAEPDIAVAAVVADATSPNAARQDAVSSNAASPNAAGASAAAPEEAATPDVVARAEPRAPAVLVARDDGVSLLQPSAARPARLDRVVIDVISYDAEGTVLLEGRSAAPPPPVDSVRIYLNNAQVDTTPILDDGSWRLPLRDVASGVYTLRVDQVDAAGNVVSQFETPFKREDPANLARLEAERPEPEGGLDVSVITVQPGFTLWGIASERYGDGLQYVAIFDANSTQIRDPDLIFPGQVFDLPDVEADGR